MTDRVNQLRVVDSSLPQNSEHPDPLGNSVTLDIPWDYLPTSSQAILQSLDIDHNGIIDYAPSLERQRRSFGEIRNSDQTASILSRLFWAYAGTHPYNNRVQDRETQEFRRSSMANFHLHMQQQVISPLLASYQPQRWAEAARLWELTAYPSGLRLLGEQLLRNAHTREDHDQAEGFFLSALRFASQIPDDDHTMISRIDQDLQFINPFLDTWDTREFLQDIDRPYLLATIGSPITAELSELESGQTFPAFVAVPTSVLPADREAFVRNYLNTRAYVRIQPFREGGPQYRLIAQEVIEDRRGPLDDPIETTFSPHVTQNTLTVNLFNHPSIQSDQHHLMEMSYFRVYFHFENTQIARQALGGRTTRKFDIIMNRPAGAISNGVRSQRIMEGSFVLQDTANQEGHTVFGSDIHISKRDQKIVAEVVERLLQNPRHPDYPPYLLEELERLYESATERVIASVEVWNESYRRGEIDRVAITGDLADFVNIAETMRYQTYRSTNIRQLMEVINRIEAPTYVDSGNHDLHVYAYPISIECRTLLRNPALCSLYEDGYDHPHFSGPLILNGIAALIPDNYNSPIAAASRVFFQVYRTNPYSQNQDAPLNHHLQRLGIYENYGLQINRHVRLYMMKTGPEDFSYLNYLYTRTRPPRREMTTRALHQYVTGHRVNGRGPLQEEFVAFLREVQEAQRNGTKIILAFHYPVFAEGDGPDGTPHNSDTLRDEVSRAYRLLTWFARHEDDTPVIPMVIAGHTHAYEETDFDFNFHNPNEEREVHHAVAQIIADVLSDQTDPAEQSNRINWVFRNFDAVWNQYHLSEHLQIRNVTRPGAEGIPSALAREHASPQTTMGTHRSLFVNLPALGPESLSGNGYMILTTRPDGSLSYEMRFIRIRPDGQIVVRTGQERNQFLREEEEEIRAWDPSYSFQHSPINNGTTMIQSRSYVHSEQHLSAEFFPTICSYPQGDACFNLRLGVGGSYTNTHGVIGLFRIGLDFQVPTSSVPRNIIAITPNYIYGGGSWNPAQGEFGLYAGSGHGLLETEVFARHIDRDQWVIGGGLSSHWGLPSLPQYLGFAPNVFSTLGANTVTGNVEVMAGFTWSAPILGLYQANDNHRH